MLHHMGLLRRRWRIGDGWGLSGLLGRCTVCCSGLFDIVFGGGNVCKVFGDGASPTVAVGCGLCTGTHFGVTVVQERIGVRKRGTHFGTLPRRRFTTTTICATTTICRTRWWPTRLCRRLLLMHLLHPLLHLGLLLLFLRMKPSECLVTNQWLHLTGQDERRDTLDGGWDAFAGSRIDGNTVHRRRHGQVLQFLKKLTAMAAAIAVEEHYGLRHME